MRSREHPHVPGEPREKLQDAAPPRKNAGMSELSFPAYSDSELVLGLVAPVGTNLDKFVGTLEAILREFDYSCNPVRFSNLATTLVGAPDEPPLNEFDRLTQLMDAGNAAREQAGAADVLSLAAAASMYAQREGASNKEPSRRTAHILRSLKHPAEVITLRRIYGPAFFLIGVVTSEDDRRRYLKTARSCTDEQ